MPWFNDLRKARLRRFLRQTWACYWLELVGPFWERSQVLALLQAVTATYLILQTASNERFIEEVSSWELAFHSFAFVMTLWAAFCVIRAPMIARREEAKEGTWHGSRFVYRRPKLVATLRCKATGQPQWHRVSIDHVEPNSFVYYEIETDNQPSSALFSACLVGAVVLKGRDTEPGQGSSGGGMRIGSDRVAHLLVVMKEEMVSQTFRILIRDFSIGNPDDHDGAEGEFREAFRRSLD